MTAAFDLGGLANGSPATGFQNQTDSTIAFNDGLMRFSIWPTVPGGTFNVFVGGMQFVKTVQEDYVWTDTEGLWLAYYDGAGVLQATQNSTLISNIFKGAGAPVAAWYWDAANDLTLRQIDERHNVGLDPYTHWYLHTYFGTAYESGLGLADFTIVAGAATLPAHAQFSVANGVVADEDLRRLINDGFPQDLAPILNAPIFYLSGATPGVWRRKAADAYPLIYSGTAGYVGANGRLPYNQLSGGNWLLTEISSPDFVLVHYFATTDINEPVIGVQGQAIYLTAAAARAGALTEINTILGLSALLSTEKRAIASVIFQSGTAYANVPKAKVVVTDTGANYVDWRATAFFAGIAGGSPANSLDVITPLGTVSVGAFGNIEGWSAAPSTYVFTPSGTSDDWARLQTVADSLINTGATIQFAPGTYRNTVQFELKEGHPCMIAGPTCRFISSQAETPAAPIPAAFYFTPALLGPTTVTIAASSGSRTIVVDSITSPVIADGSVIEIASGSQYDVIGAPTASGGDWMLTLDRPLAYPVAIGAEVRVTPTHPKDWSFDYNGAEVTGNTSRYWSISRAENCCIKNAIVTDRFGVADAIGSFDNTGRNNRFENIQYRSIAGTYPNNGLIAETNENTVCERCILPGCGFYFDGTWGCVFRECKGLYHHFACDQAALATGNSVEGGTYGRMSHGSAGGLAGTVRSTTYTKVRYVAETTLVGQVSGNAIDVLFDRCTFELQPLNSSQAFSSGYAIPKLKFRNCTFTANRSTYSAISQANRSYAISIGGPSGVHEVSVDDCTVSDMVAIFAGQGTTKIRVKNSTFDTLMVGNGFAVPPLVIAGTACDFEAEDMTLLNPESPGYAAALQATHGLYRLHNCTAAGYFWGAAGESSVKLTGTSVGNVNVNSVSVSPSTATLASGSIAVPFYAIRAGDAPTVEQLTGTATAFTIAVNAGVGFTITGAAGTYRWALP